MASYELIYILRPNLEEERLETVVQRVGQAVAAAGGQVAQEERWGKRRLAYPIRHFQEGTYILNRLEMESRQVSSLERSLRLWDEVLRHLIVRVDKN